ncbi:AAA family ATPase [Delftia acidovorans]|uniref:AAA family ATPase n=1 Tax=Delftia acidovorans TaxID=80866 RepID=UPI00334093AC
MISNIKISRFKSLKNLSLDLGRVNIFVGSNGAGKSSILEAIGLSSAAIYRSIEDRDLISRGIRLTPTELMKSSFKNDKTAQTFEICLNFSDGLFYKCNLSAKENDPLLRFHSESCTLNGKKQFGRSGNGSTVLGNSISVSLDKDRGMWDQVRTAHKFPEELVSQFDEFSKYKIFTPQTDILRGSRSGVVDSGPLGIHGEGLPTALKAALNYSNRLRGEELKWFNNLSALSFLPGWNEIVKVGRIDSKLVSRGIQEKNSDMVYFIDKYMKNSRNTLSVYDSSEGTLFLLFIFALFAHPESPRYFALDNVDNALNPVMNRRLLEAIIKAVSDGHALNLPFGPRQVFMTSHNPTALDAFDIFDEDQRIFVVKRADDGCTTATQLKPRDGMTRDEWKVASSGRNLSQLWLDGMIKGINGAEAI